MKNRKPWMAAILSTALLFSGALSLAPKAFADDDDYPVIERVKAPLDRQQYITDRLNKLITMTVAFSDKDYVDVQDALLNGQSLAQASSMDSSLLGEKLRAWIDQDLSSTLQNYSITNEQLAELKSDLYNSIQVALSTPGYQVASVKGGFNYDALMNTFMKQLENKAAAISDEDYVDVHDRVLKGSSLAEATLLDQSFLRDALASPILQELDKAVAANLLTADEAAKLKDQANNSILSAVSLSNGIDVKKESTFDTQALISKHLASIFNDAFLVTNTEDLEYNELKSAYNQGGSLTSLTATSTDELAARILNLWNNDMQAVSDNLSAQESAEFQQKVTDAIRAAVNAAGK
ncbi:hypothetical protein [Paenibacillus sp. FSL H8-0034]|uniref:hypothetical protein n=1 Tax=Paenibacillus sp. FSL H8-0034 TaxID=2954671 RepID=UPI0030F90D3F